jgi:hypothetical protein
VGDSCPAGAMVIELGHLRQLAPTVSVRPRQCLTPRPPASPWPCGWWGASIEDKTQEEALAMEEMEKFVAQHKHANVPGGWPGSTQMKVPLGKRVIQWRHHCVPGVTISARHCQSLIYKHAFMFSCTNLAVHVYKCLQQTDPDFPLETLRTADPWAPQPTPVEAQMNRLLSIVAERHPTWLATAGPKRSDQVPFGKKPLDVKARYRKDVAKAVASKTLGKRKR